MYAILKTIKLSQKNNYQFILICCDSLSCLQTLEQMYTKNQIGIQILDDIYDMRHEKDFTIMWIPSHMNIVGNEKADFLAKEALQASLDANYEFIVKDFKPLIRESVTELWNKSWNTIPLTSKFKKIKPTV